MGILGGFFSVTPPFPVAARHKVGTCSGSLWGGGGEGGGGGTEIMIIHSCWYQTLEQNGNELTVSLMVMLVVMSAANLAKMSVTMARLPVVCSCSLAAAPLTAPLTAVTASS